MPSNYRTGARLENDVKAILTEDDWVAVRAAGSHGIVDVMADKYGEVWLIQCRKSGYLFKNEREELIALAKKHKAVPILVYKVKGGIVFQEVKPKKPTFHYEVVNGRFTKVDNQ